MIEMKELQTLVVCAEVHSFTRAAEILYTTQPNVSKMIRSLEKKLGFPVFFRDNKGIRLTKKGELAYEYAAGIVAKEEELAGLLQLDSREEFSVITNPSSWVSGVLTAYFRRFGRDTIRYCFLEGSVSDVFEEVGSGKSELGLIFYRKEQQTGIDYQLQRRGLCFHELKRLCMWLYYGAHAVQPAAVSGEGEDSLQAHAGRLRLIQCYDDEFAFSHDENPADAGRIAAGSVSVLTNSDYIMNRMLKETDLCNISAEDPGGAPEFKGQAVQRKAAGQEVLFGYVERDGGERSACARELLAFLDERLQTSQG